MPLFMDIHRINGVAADDVAVAHEADLQMQDKYGARFMRYWVDEDEGRVFCLVEAPTADDARAVHREAHGLLPDEIFEVKEGS